MVENFRNACHHSSQTSKTSNYTKDTTQVRATLSNATTWEWRLWRILIISWRLWRIPTIAWRHRRSLIIAVISRLNNNLYGCILTKVIIKRNNSYFIAGL